MKLKRNFYLLLLVCVTSLTLAFCGGGDDEEEDDDDDTETETPTANASQLSNGTSSELEVVYTESDALVVAEVTGSTLVRGLVKNATTSFDNETIEVACDNTGGSISIVVDGDIVIDDASGDITSGDVNVDATFTDCEQVEAYDVSTDTDCTSSEDANCCSYSVTFNGTISCVLSYSGNSVEEDISSTFTCETTSACTGMTATFNGTDSTQGTDGIEAVIATVGEAPTLTGNICINDETFDFDEVTVLTDYELTDLTCE